MEITEEQFNIISAFCKHCKLGRQDGEYLDTCNHPNNTPVNCSWGKCEIDKCPLIKYLEKK